MDSISLFIYVRSKMLSIDTETTGLDPYHGTRPFLVAACELGDEPTYWEWPVDPLTRTPIVDREDIKDIQEYLDSQDCLILHNAIYDVKMLELVGVQVDWSKVHDTTLILHMLNSVMPQNLTTACSMYLGQDISRYESRLEWSVKECRSLAPDDWRLAKKGLPEMPSAKKDYWKADMWVPRALGEEEHTKTVIDYATVDAEATVCLYHTTSRIIRERGLQKVYEERRKILPVVYKMENRGITYNVQRLNELTQKYKKELLKHKRRCVSIAKSYNYELTMPEGAVNDSIRNFVFDVLELPVAAKSKKTGNPSLSSKDALPTYLDTLPPRSKSREFIRCLGEARKRSTAVSYMSSYRTYSLREDRETCRLHPSVNVTGTNTLRSSSKRPNEQNISKKQGFNLRYAFGPSPGREWWSLDYNNLELRIPAYECQEPAMLELFEHPNDPPYFGSYHLLIFSILYPDEFRKHGAEVKDKYKSTLYQWTKNGNFAELYGAVDTGDGKSTADRAFHYPGAQAIVASKLKKKSALNQYWIDFARKYGYVETIPDITVDPEQGYQLTCPKRFSGYSDYISPTIPLNYHVQGTACWVKMKAMIKVQDYFDRVNSKRPSDKHCYIIMDVHDEIVLDLPYRPHLRNRSIIKQVRKLMESCGDDIQIPLTVGVDYNPVSWDKGIELED